MLLVLSFAPIVIKGGIMLMTVRIELMQEMPLKRQAPRHHVSGVMKCIGATHVQSLHNDGHRGYA